jgi:hypothetical protein
LKELRLAREAAEPPPAPAAPKKARAKSSKSSKPDEKGPTLTAWLETQQNSGRRT